MERERDREKEGNGEQLDEGLLLTRRRVIPRLLRSKTAFTCFHQNSTTEGNLDFHGIAISWKTQRVYSSCQEGLILSVEVDARLDPRHFPFLIINAHV